MRSPAKLLNLVAAVALMVAVLNAWGMAQTFFKPITAESIRSGALQERAKEFIYPRLTRKKHTQVDSLTDVPNCPLGPPQGPAGSRRLALVVGVGKYKSEQIRDLVGPTNDAQAFYELLTGTDGYRFPKENVCLLLDEDATTANFRKAFDQALIKRVEGGDVAVLFFAGHSSQVQDTNDDETDKRDETLLFHDSRTSEIGDLVDDELNQMLVRLYERTKHIVLFFDSSNAGTVSDAKGLPGMVTFAGTGDGYAAMEKNGRGIFTAALQMVMAQGGDRPLTYAQVARQMRPLVAADSYQIPYVHGKLDVPVFGKKDRARPPLWEIVAFGPPLELAGPPMPGMGIGAEMRVYDGADTTATRLHSSAAKAVVVVEDTTGLQARASIEALHTGAPAIDIGDLAVLIRPSYEFPTLTVRLRPESEQGGILDRRAEQLRKAIEEDANTSMLVELAGEYSSFELSVGPDGRLMLRGPENSIRNIYDDDRQVPGGLARYVRQKELLQLRGAVGGDHVDHQTLMVSLVSAVTPRRLPHTTHSWIQSPPNTSQVIPLCHPWHVQVMLSEQAPAPLLVGGVVLSADGTLIGFPTDGRKVRLAPGETYTFDAEAETFIGTPPLDVQEFVIVFGTHENNPVDWHLLTDEEYPISGIYRSLNKYAAPGARGVPVVEELAITTWTLSTIIMRVTANPPFLQRDENSRRPFAWGKYASADFDIRPYLPDDPDTALYKVLKRADWLARYAAAVNTPHASHAWQEPTDEANLVRGINSSRAIWFAFTRAGLPYNQKDHHLTTLEMANENTLMRDEFENCSDEPYSQIGDILVYRNEDQGDGHAVMVIDPYLGNAWGSWSWYEPKSMAPSKLVSAVQYQKINTKKDWWGRPGTRRIACWRYSRFIEERQGGRGVPGLDAVAGACSAYKRW